MTAPAAGGLRERKRRDVRARIEEAAILLVLRDGLEATTVDAISERADISARTFFNYFDSKDGALLGLHQWEPEGEPPGPGAGVGVVESVVRLLMSVVGAPLTSRSKIHDDRMELIRRHPQVLSSQFAQLAARASRLTEVIEGFLAASPAAAGATAADRQAQAEVLLAAGGGALRVAVREWVAAGSPGSTADIERRAAALIHQIVRTLA